MDKPDMYKYVVNMEILKTVFFSSCRSKGSYYDCYQMDYKIKENSRIVCIIFDFAHMQNHRMFVDGSIHRHLG